MFLVAVVVLTAMQGDRYTTGLALAIAGTLKVFPLVLVICLLVMRRWRAVTATAVGLGVLNLIPLLMPNVSLAPMVSAMTDTAEAWIDLTIGIPGLVAQWSTSSNLLTVSLVAVATIGFASVPVVRRNVTMQLGALGLLSASLLVLPISWPHYVLTLIPVWMLIDQDASLRRPVVVLLILGGVMLVPLTPIALHTAGLVLIVIAVATQGFYARQPISAGTRTAAMI
jgi:alpha-1,2-mannosyltransferase